MWKDCIDCPLLVWCVGRCDNMTAYLECTDTGKRIAKLTTGKEYVVKEV
ncbi:MAG: hypothetical protein PVI03_04310 [Candidatus Thorarchaeota archaeon]|jgi:hypothetical protein